MRISDWSSDVCSSDLAGVVAAGSFVGCRAAPILALLVSRRERLCRRDDHHVEVARAQALDVLRGVDKARPHLDAEAAQIEEEGQENPLLALIAVEELEAEASPGDRKSTRLNSSH